MSTKEEIEATNAKVRAANNPDPKLNTVTASVAATTAVVEKPTASVPLTSTLGAPTEFTDDDLVTVLYGFGKVAPTSVSWLDDYRVEGGVVRNVPFGVARHWKRGTRPDGKKAQGRVNVTILPQEATEQDFLTAAGLSPEDMRRLAAVFNTTDIQSILDQLGPDKALALRDAISKKYSGK